MIDGSFVMYLGLYITIGIPQLQLGLVTVNLKIVKMQMVGGLDMPIMIGILRHQLG